ncbi:MAG: hypothetical protein A3H06_02080 [Candidatus Colwellbacteria bacterium RIFCSPLOWO2_12_FULL_44_13]|uniref:Nudix hydrolase domain-containing protein n=3 Tax=Candidatus Colwelliibacteriota TaxID=1817904 RepID=A0A1G1Z8Q7_9BACT|nr:MAG: hypothetical protein A3F24_01510 [Candidatus Colwellbacteria bacterium RIFCSPHIGHO2_12_FULL_44_17]OGY60819.1 MAG: hypothetical protein A3I31_02465 [Candidatus Colwellbacteria bacterium RIFCSPLOWO2_02_FULL_44_20b]OGY62011.1 MAG: hypothetical protein A3H06_02080 [Candidatus Colwellbacteria bacterium RIFCSPLOWO2_12_FULL_44_13]
MEKVADIISLREGRILLVHKQGFWILPGGKIRPGESFEKTIRRELREEIGGTRVHVGNLYKILQGVTPHSKEPIEVFACLGYVHEPRVYPRNEIDGAMWARIDEELLKEFRLSEITQQIIDSLRRDRFLYGGSDNSPRGLSGGETSC